MPSRTCELINDGAGFTSGATAADETSTLAAEATKTCDADAGATKPAVARTVIVGFVPRSDGSCDEATLGATTGAMPHMYLGTRFSVIHLIAADVRAER